jgi:hypothetical protein
MQAKFSVRADLYRVAHSFMDVTVPKYAGVRIEPLDRGGVVMIGWNGADLIVLEDDAGAIDRPATIHVGRGMVNLAVDLFRRGGIETTLAGDGDVAMIRPEATGAQVVKDYERVGYDYPDWRTELARHVSGGRINAPVMYEARMARRVSDAAIGLAAAAGVELQTFELDVGNGAVVATFPSWPSAAAIFNQPAQVR